MSQGSVRPKDYNFRSAGLSLFQLRMSFGQPGDCFVGGTVVFNNMFVDVYVQQMVEIPDATGAITSPIALKKISYQELALLSSNANQDIRLPAGNNIKSVVMRTDGSTTAGEPSVAVLNNVILGAGVDVRLNLSAAQLRAKNNQDYGLITAGYYIADLTTKADAPVNLTDLWDVTGAAEPKLTLDVTGGANVKMQAVVTEYILAGSPS
jgi:Tfp pilus assembly protein PilW